MLGSIPATWATVTTFAADDAAVMGFSELANAVVKEFFPWEAPKLIDMAGPAAVTGYAQPSWSVVTGAAVAVAGFWGGLGTWLGHLFDKRDVQSVSIITHFCRTNFTIADVRGLNGFIIEPQVDGSAMFRQGDYSWPGQVALVCVTDSMMHSWSILSCAIRPSSQLMAYSRHRRVRASHTESSNFIFTRKATRTLSMVSYR